MRLNWLFDTRKVLKIVKIEHNMELMLDKAELRKIGGHNVGNWMDFHADLIDLRIAKGITQAEVAKLLGISQPAISQFEKLNSMPHIETVLAYALAIGAKLNFSIED
jgi:DNA-binding XRE family transcriptional regulator